MAGPPALSAHVSLAEALVKGPPPPGNLAVPVFAHGSLEECSADFAVWVFFYGPRGGE